MFDFLLISPFLVTSAYAACEMWKSPHARGWSLAVIGSAGLMTCCLFWLEPVLDFLHIASGGFDFDRVVYVIVIRIIAFILHIFLLGILFRNSGPDIPYREADRENQAW